jgi:hypothetical protein
MACIIYYKDQQVSANNRQFYSLIEFAIEVGQKTATTDEERQIVDRMIDLRDKEFFPGRDLDIEEDFPDLNERKYWARVFLDTARAIFGREVGVHEYSFWQAQCIYQAYGVGLLFEQAVRSQDSHWMPNSTDRREFDRVVNKKS